MDKRKITGILIILAGSVILAGIIYFMFFYNNTGEVILEGREATSQPTLPTSVTQPTDKPKAVIEIEPPTGEEAKQADLKQLSIAFAERFGSYSNQSDYGNIRDLKIFMTEDMQKWADNYISESRAEKSQTSVYEGVITKAITAEIRQFDEISGLAEISVKTQRKQATVTTDNTSTYYQDIIIKFVREREEWKVDSAEWQ